MMVGEHERTIELFGSEVRILIGAPVSANRAPALAAMELEALLRKLHRVLTRFDPSSELSRLNADPLERHQASPLLALALRAGLWAAEETSGLVDPTLAGELEEAGYASSRAGLKGASL